MQLRLLGGLVLAALCSPALAEGLRWRASDAAGREAWAVVLREEPGLAADVRAARLDPRRRLQQISVDLDGDGVAELLLSPQLDSWCGSAGCVTFILRRDAARGWETVCQTYAQYGGRGRGDIEVTGRGAIGWRDIEATSRIRWERDDSGRVACVEQHR